MVTGWHRPTWIEVNGDAIRANITNEKAHLPAETAVWAVVKANAYGHGIIEVAKIAKSAGADGFCVAILDEALALREAGFTSELILVLGAVPAEYANLAAEKQISLTLFDESWLTELPVLTAKLSLHVKLDTGMGRLGFRNGEALKRVSVKLAEQPLLEWEGIYTHFATADQKDTTYYEEQLAKFEGLLSEIKPRPRFVHVANSSAALLHNQTGFNAVRFGIAMYGLTPSDEIADILPFELQPALSLYTKIVQVKQLQAGDCVSYGATYQAAQEEWVATLPIGYADGWIRKYTGFSLLVEGEYAEIVGRVCMDQLIIRLPRYYPVGTKVTLIGKSGDKQITAEEAAHKIETIDYEVTCLLSERIPRIYN